MITAQIVDAFCAPRKTVGNIGDTFKIFVTGETLGTGSNVIWLDIEGVDGSRADSDAPWGPGLTWFFMWGLSFLEQPSPGEYNFKVRAGHVENGADVVDDTMLVPITVGDIGVQSRITSIISPTSIDRSACTNFSVEPQGITYNSAGETAKIWVDIMWIDSRAESEPFPPDTPWNVVYSLHVEQDLTVPELVLWIRTGHVEGGVDIIDDIQPVFILVKGATMLLEVVVPTNGTTNPVPGNYYYEYNTLSDAFYAVADEGYEFDYWDVQNVSPYTSKENPIQVMMDYNYVLTAHFKQAAIPCFIATAAYGTSLAPQLNVLRNFRNRCLPDKLTQMYYKVSPPLAKFIAKHWTIRSLTRYALEPLVRILKREK